MNLRFIYPELIIFAISFVCLFWPEKKRRPAKLFGPVFIGLCAVLMAILYTLLHAGDFGTLHEMFSVDPITICARIMIMLCAVSTLMIACEDTRISSIGLGPFCSLLLCSTAGFMLLSGAQDFILLYICFELASLPLVVIMYMHRINKYGGEGAVKFFIFHLFSSVILLYGISLIYTVAGTTNLQLLSLRAVEGILHSHPVFIAGLVCVLGGLMLKIGAVPFHSWIPDVIESSATPVSGYITVAPKIAVMAVLVRIFVVRLPYQEFSLTGIFLGVAVCSMSLGNLAALFQQNIKRLLAYSSIAHIGFIMTGFIIGFPIGIEGILIYLSAYCLNYTGLFALIMIVGARQNSYSLNDYTGLAQRNLPAALLLAVLICSCVGIPLTAGFLGKWYIFSALVDAGYFWLLMICMINMLISVYYYFNILQKVFFVNPVMQDGVAFRFGTGCVIGACVLGTLWLGILPEKFIAVSRLIVSWIQ